MTQRATLGSELSTDALNLVQGGRSRWRGTVETVEQIGRGFGRMGKDALDALGGLVKEGSELIGKVVGGIKDLFD